MVRRSFEDYWPLVCFAAGYLAQTASKEEAEGK
jgi:hypothetical protein